MVPVSGLSPNEPGVPRWDLDGDKHGYCWGGTPNHNYSDYTRQVDFLRKGTGVAGAPKLVAFALLGYIRIINFAEGHLPGLTPTPTWSKHPSNTSIGAKLGNISPLEWTTMRKRWASSTTRSRSEISGRGGEVARRLGHSGSTGGS